MDNETRNNYQQYDWVEVFKNFETKIKKGIKVATMAVVLSVDGDTLNCMPFPIEEDSETKAIKAYNISNSTYSKGDKCLVIFTDRDFRYNINNVTTDSNSVAETSNATLHSDLYGIVISAIDKTPIENYPYYDKATQATFKGIEHTHNYQKAQIKFNNNDGSISIDYSDNDTSSEKTDGTISISYEKTKTYA